MRLKIKAFLPHLDYNQAAIIELNFSGIDLVSKSNPSHPVLW